MYSLTSERSFDAAHFLKGYQGKCGNIHGHRWRVLVNVEGESLNKEGQTKGMVLDFGEIKSILKEETDYFDHTLIYETNSLKPLTVTALKEEGFLLREVPFRPTAEEFAAYFYQKMKEKGISAASVTVYETPKNCAQYREG